MDEWDTSIAATLIGTGVVLAGIIATRPRPKAALGEVRMLPWNSIMLVGMIAAVLGAVHLITLWRGI